MALDIGDSIPNIHNYRYRHHRQPITESQPR